MSTFRTVLSICTLRNCMFIILVAARSKARVCGRSIAGIAGSNPAGSIDICVGECCVLSERSICDGPIVHPEESYRVWCV